MADKLLIEIEIIDQRLEDAVPALVYLANELTENEVIELTSPPAWRQKGGSGYDLKWRWSDNEVQIPFGVDNIWELERELTNLIGPKADKQSPLLTSFLKYLREELAEHTTDMYAEAA